MPIYQTGPNTWSNRLPASSRKRSRLGFPFVISDEMPPTEQVDGKFYTSKRAFRAVGRANGLTEVGDQQFKPKWRSTDLAEVKARRRQTLKRAVDRVKGA